jgi:uncharacterized protein (DUF58 family)
VIRRGVLVTTPAVLLFGAAAMGSLAFFAFAVGLLALYGAVAVVLAVAAHRLVVARTIDRTEVQEGHPILLHFQISGLRGLPVRVEALGADGAWHALDGGLRCVVDRPGAHILDASPLRLTDDLGLFSRAVRGGRPESVLVLPTPTPPPEHLRRGGSYVAGDPEPDGLRPYTPGTPISRVHWVSAARGGQLQERHFVTGRDQLPLVVVDTADADDAALDWVARSAAGIVLALARHGGCRVLLPGDREPTIVPDAGVWPAIHRRLAALEPDVPAAAVYDRDVLHVRAANAPEELDDRGELPPGVLALADWVAA